MKLIGLFSALVACILAVAGFAGEGKKAPSAKWTGSIKVHQKLSQAQLQRMAKITPSQSVKTALAVLPGKTADKKVIDSELEVERGFLVYCIDVKIKGQKGEHEVLVDAGTGKVLAQQLEDDDDDDEDDNDDDG